MKEITPEEMDRLEEEMKQLEAGLEQKNESKKERTTGTVILVLVIAAFIGLLLCRLFGFLGSSGGT